MTISYQELLTESQKFITFLQHQNIEAVLDMSSFRDYNVKIRLLDIIVILYHKPSKKTFSLVFQTTNDSKKEQIQELWHRYLFPNEQKTTGICAYVDGSCMHGKIG
ncbi:MAG: hypothetical protein ACRCTJ_00745, partial [Brevinema sp.]